MHSVALQLQSFLASLAQDVQLSDENSFLAVLAPFRLLLSVLDTAMHELLVPS